ncbi:hypothetical protein Esti_003323 [Eimeria stiedai]
MSRGPAAPAQCQRKKFSRDEWEQQQEQQQNLTFESASLRGPHGDRRGPRGAAERGPPTGLSSSSSSSGSRGGKIESRLSKFQATLRALPLSLASPCNSSSNRSSSSNRCSNEEEHRRSSSVSKYERQERLETQETLPAPFYRMEASQCSSSSSAISDGNASAQQRKQRMCSKMPGALADLLARQQQAECHSPSLQQQSLEQQQQQQQLLQQLPRYFCCLFPPPPLNRRGQGYVTQQRATVSCICIEQTSSNCSSSSSSNSSSSSSNSNRDCTSKVCVACMQHYVDGLRPEVFSPHFSSASCPLHLKASFAAAAPAAAAAAAGSGTAAAAGAAAESYAEVYVEYVQRLLPLVQQEMQLPSLPSLQGWLPSSLLGAPALRLTNSSSSSRSGCRCWLESPCFFPAVFAIPPDSTFPSSQVYRQQLLHPFDAASAAAAAALRPIPGSKCLDLCCAPGNKLLLLAAAVSSRPAAAAAAAEGHEASQAAAAEGCVVGVDVSPARMEVCRRLLRRNGCSNALLVLADGTAFGTSSCCCSSNCSVTCMQSAGTANDTTAEGKMRRGRLSKKKEKRRQEAREVPLVSLLPQDCSSSNSSSSRCMDAKSLAANVPTGLQAAPVGSLRAAAGTAAAGTAAAGTAAAGTAATEAGAPELHNSSSSNSSSSRDADVAAVFERVLVDVQCTHDASIRHMARLERVIRETRRQQQLYGQQQQQENVTVLPAEPPVQGKNFLELQQLQQRLLRRAFALLSPGGLLVYSSCSRDRRQNEDAVLQLLQLQQNALLYPLPCSDLLYDGTYKDNHMGGPSGAPKGSVNVWVSKVTCHGMHAQGPHEGPQEGLCGGPLREFSERLSIKTGRGASPPTDSALLEGEGGPPSICPVRGAPCRGFADAYAFLEEHAVWPAAPSGLERMLELPRHHSCWRSSSGSNSSRRLRPSSCQFMEEKGHTSGIFVCCITKKMPQSELSN